MEGPDAFLPVFSRVSRINNENYFLMNMDSPDVLTYNWRNGLNEFSIENEIAYEKHLAWLTECYKNYKITYIDYRKHSYRRIKELEDRINRLIGVSAP